MKKLMVLGGSRYALPVIEAAHRLGIYVITCDYLPDNIAHKYSDEYCNVSIIDQEKTLDAARKLNIDGIMSFACDKASTNSFVVFSSLADSPSSRLPSDFRKPSDSPYSAKSLAGSSEYLRIASIMVSLSFGISCRNLLDICAAVS